MDSVETTTTTSSTTAAKPTDAAIVSLSKLLQSAEASSAFLAGMRAGASLAMLPPRPLTSDDTRSAILSSLMMNNNNVRNDDRSLKDRDVGDVLLSLRHFASNSKTPEWDVVCTSSRLPTISGRVLDSTSATKSTETTSSVGALGTGKSTGDAYTAVDSKENTPMLPTKLSKKAFASATDVANREYFDSYTEADVLFGRGGLVNHQPGNQWMLDDRDQMFPEYIRSSKIEKYRLSHELVNRVSARGGRFLKWDAANNGWYVVPKNVARRKASQALREGEKRVPTATSVASTSGL